MGLSFDVGYLVDGAKCFALSIVAYVLLYGGLTFINGRLFPDFLEGIYAHTGSFWRLMIFLFVAAWPANYLLAKTFQIADASIAGPSILAAIVLITVANSFVLDGTRLTLPVFGATCLAVFSCALVSWLLVTQNYR